jgi:predicted dehydrogenase
MNQDKQIRMAVIGCGAKSFPYRFLHDCTKGLPFRLAAVCGDAESRRAFSERYYVPSQYGDYREMLRCERPDFVVAFPPEAEQLSVTADCLNAGAYVFCERPVVSSLDEAHKLAAMQEKTGRSVLTRLSRRFTPAYRMAWDTIRKPEFGEPSMYLAKYHAAPYASEDSFIWYHIIHHMDLARYLLGELRILAVDRVRLDDTRVGFNILFRSRSGCSGVLQTSSLQRGEYPVERVEITGDGRNLMVDNLRYVEYLRPTTSKMDPASMTLGDADALIWKPNAAHLDNYTYYGFEACFSHIADCILAGRRSEHDFSDTVHTIALIEQILTMLKASDKEDFICNIPSLAKQAEG